MILRILSSVLKEKKRLCNSTKILPVAGKESKERKGKYNNTRGDYICLKYFSNDISWEKLLGNEKLIKIQNEARNGQKRFNDEYKKMRVNKIRKTWISGPNFETANNRLNVKSIENIILKKNETKDLLKGLDKIKAEGPVSNCILKESAELCTPLLLIIHDSVRPGKLTKSWKRQHHTLI